MTRFPYFILMICALLISPTFSADEEQQPPRKPVGSALPGSLSSDDAGQSERRDESTGSEPGRQSQQLPAFDFSLLLGGPGMPDRGQSGLLQILALTATSGPQPEDGPRGSRGVVMISIPGGPVCPGCPECLGNNAVAEGVSGVQRPRAPHQQSAQAEENSGRDGSADGDGEGADGSQIQCRQS